MERSITVEYFLEWGENVRRTPTVINSQSFQKHCENIVIQHGGLREVSLVLTGIFQKGPIVVNLKQQLLINVDIIVNIRVLKTIKTYL